MAGHTPWSEIKHKKRERDAAAATEPMSPEQREREIRELMVKGLSREDAEFAADLADGVHDGE